VLYSKRAVRVGNEPASSPTTKPLCGKIPAMEKAVAREVCNFALGRIQGRIVSFDK